MSLSDSSVVFLYHAAANKYLTEYLYISHIMYQIILMVQKVPNIFITVYIPQLHYIHYSGKKNISYTTFLIIIDKMNNYIYTFLEHLKILEKDT